MPFYILFIIIIIIINSVPLCINPWQECPKWHASFTVVPIFSISFALPASLYCEDSVYIYPYLTAYRLYMNYRCYQITMQ